VVQTTGRSENCSVIRTPLIKKKEVKRSGGFVVENRRTPDLFALLFIYNRSDQPAASESCKVG
jgi:hypothetical protein